MWSTATSAQKLAALEAEAKRAKGTIPETAWYHDAAIRDSKNDRR
jgi:hypothetical protein